MLHLNFLTLLRVLEVNIDLRHVNRIRYYYYYYYLLPGLSHLLPGLSHLLPRLSNLLPGLSHLFSGLFPLSSFFILTWFSGMAVWDYSSSGPEELHACFLDFTVSSKKPPTHLQFVAQRNCFRSVKLFHNRQLQLRKLKIQSVNIDCSASKNNVYLISFIHSPYCNYSFAVL